MSERRAYSECAARYARTLASKLTNEFSIIERSSVSCRDASRCTWDIIGRRPCDGRVVIHAFNPYEILFFLD